MYEASRPQESNQAFSGCGTVDEGTFDTTGLLGKLKTLIRETEEESAKRHKKKDKKSEIDQEYDKEKFTSKNIKAHLEEFTEWTTVLQKENDRLSEKIDKESEAFNDHGDMGKSSDKKVIEYLKTENVKLREACKEISRINKDWQRYNKEVHLYIGQLELVIQKGISGEHGFLTEEELWLFQLERGTLSGAEEADTPLQTRYNNLLKGACELQKELEVSRKAEERLKNELEVLRSKSSESIELLKCQLALYKEDYKAETQEKQTLQTTATELSVELNRVRSQLREYQRRIKEVQEISRSVVVKDSRDSPGFGFNTTGRGHSSRRGGDLSADGPADDTVTSDSYGEKDEETHPMMVSAYECPGCGKTFPSDRHTEYLEHYEQCQGTELP